MDADRMFKVLSSGFLIVGGEKLMEGMFETWMKQITVPIAIEWVSGDKSLWENMEPKWQSQLMRYGPKLGDFKFLTVEWAVKIARNTNPSLASLFLNWPEAQTWLTWNIEELKKQCRVDGKVKQ